MVQRAVKKVNIANQESLWMVGVRNQPNQRVRRDVSNT
jgi:hypothetical protein